MKEIIYTPKGPAAVGPYSQAVVAGNLVFVSGQLYFDPATGALIEGSMADKTRQCLKNISVILEEAGCTLANVVKTTIFLTDINDFAEVNGAYAELFPSEPPARSCVQVAKLPKGASIEIEVIASR